MFLFDEKLYGNHTYILLSSVVDSVKIKMT